MKFNLLPAIGQKDHSQICSTNHSSVIDRLLREEQLNILIDIFAVGLRQLGSVQRRKVSPMPVTIIASHGPSDPYVQVERAHLCWNNSNRMWNNSCKQSVAQTDIMNVKGVRGKCTVEVRNCQQRLKSNSPSFSFDQEVQNIFGCCCLYYTVSIIHAMYIIVRSLDKTFTIKTIIDKVFQCDAKYSVKQFLTVFVNARNNMYVH